MNSIALPSKEEDTELQSIAPLTPTWGYTSVGLSSKYTYLGLQQCEVLTMAIKWDQVCAVYKKLYISEFVIGKFENSILNIKYSFLSRY